MNFINQLITQLEKKTIVLASGSPRRIELLQGVGLRFSVQPSGIREEPVEGMPPADYARHYARLKAQEVAGRETAGLIISADTVVALDEHLFGKPGNYGEAAHMLRTLSGRTHQVITGFCLLTPQEEIVDFEQTSVTFYDLSEPEIEAYVQSGEPFDKAGAYGIQGLGALFIKEIRGCYYNVVGFPLGKFYQTLKQLKNFST
ncbi:MAG: Maf family protein [Calditrichia bacterium]